MIALWRLGSWLMVRRRRLPVRNRFRVSDREDNLPDGGTAGEPCQGVPAFGQCINPVDARPNEPLLPPAEQLRYVMALSGWLILSERTPENAYYVTCLQTRQVKWDPGNASGESTAEITPLQDTPTQCSN